MQLTETVASSQADTGVRHSSADRLFLLLVASTPALFALLTLNPQWNAADTAFHATLRRLSYPVLVVQVLMVFFALSRGFEPLRAVRSSPRWMQAALALLVAIALGTATLVADKVPLALFRTCSWLLHMLFALAMAHLLATRWSGLRLHLWPAVVAGTCAYAFLVPVFVASIPDPRTFDWVHFGLGVVHIRQIGFYSAVGATAALGLAFYSATGRSYLFWLAAASLALALSYWSGTRSSMIAVAAAFVIVFALLPSMRSARALSGFVLSNFAGAALSLLYTPPSSLFGIFRMWTSMGADSVNAVSSGRVEMWIGTLKAIGARPFFGYGESQFRWTVPEALGDYSHPHNIVLQVAMQWGLVGAACFFALAGSLWWRMFMVTRRQPQEMVPAFFTANCLLVFSLYEGALYHPYPTMMSGLAVAFVLGSAHLNPASPRSPVPAGTATATAPLL